jgi:hypothetical protein
MWYSWHSYLINLKIGRVRDRWTDPGLPNNYLPSIDCVLFQEILLGSKLVFIGGMAEAKSKGRGEECISQNLRILRGQNNKRVMLYFANSQRGGLKRYVSLPRESFFLFRLGSSAMYTTSTRLVANPSQLIALPISSNPKRPVGRWRWN